ncbi:restriction endonuclease subunit S [Bifidobacterium ramosum]|uniref:Type I restriction modification DNA specificity domain-containing protein n=1 Tax=Bifidobacterium ramosum TaxID=1798158 RepID=A0A7K3TCE2_9BIFI|nr:restriction endonuclease subunit S [Bifidobacterium ramosum]NEG72237.1 hypothetical protein [Bifidobacterium ramosum]
MSFECALEEICDLITDGSHYSPKALPGSGFYMASVRDMNQDGFIFDGCKEISENDYNALQKNGCCPEPGDILIGKDGVRFFEDMFIYRQSQKPALLSSIAIVRPNTTLVDTSYLFNYLRQPAVIADVKLNYGSGSAIPRIVLKDFRRLPVVCPSMERQRKIGAVISAFDNAINNFNRTNGHLRERFDMAAYTV